MKMRSFRSVPLAAFIVIAGTLAAFAHAKMLASVPEDGATIAAGLSKIEVTFSHPVRLTLLRVRRSGDEADVPLQGALPATFATAASVGVDALPAGAYAVSWTAVSDDGHVMKGSFAFTVAGAPPSAPAQ